MSSSLGAAAARREARRAARDGPRWGCWAGGWSGATDANRAACAHDRNAPPALANIAEPAQQRPATRVRRLMKKNRRLECARGVGGEHALRCRPRRQRGRRQRSSRQWRWPWWRRQPQQVEALRQSTAPAPTCGAASVRALASGRGLAARAPRQSDSGQALGCAAG